MTRISLANAPKYAKAVTAGLDWITESQKEFKLKKKRLASTGSAFLTLKSSNPQSKDMVNYGFIEKAYLPREGRSVSLAAWLAHTFKSGTIFAVERVDQGEEGGEPRYWFCALMDGQVLTGSDIVDNWETIVREVQNNLDILESDAVGFVGKDASELPAYEGEAESPELAEVLNKAAHNKALLAPAVESRTPLIIGVTLIAASVAGGGGYWWHYTAEKKREAEERAIASQQNQIIRAQQQYQSILQEIAELEHAGRTLNSIWFDAMSDTPTKVGGWGLESLTCESGTCTFQYVNADLTLPKMLRDALVPVCAEVTISTEGLDATCIRNYESASVLPAEERTDPSLIESRIIDIALADTGFDSLQADLMTIGRFGNGSSYALSEAIAFPFAGSRYIPTSRNFNQGEWALTFPARHYQAILNGLNQYPSVVLDRLEANWNSQVVALAGRYLTVDRVEAAQ